MILFVPALPLQAVTPHPEPVAPREGHLRLLDRMQEILSLEYRLRSYRCHADLLNAHFSLTQFPSKLQNHPEHASIFENPKGKNQAA